MKHSKLIIILLLAFIGCRNNEEPINFKKGSVIINGRIDNPTVKTISVISLDVLSGRKQNTFRLNHDGSFFFTVETVGAHDNYLRYNNDLVTFFAEPNDSLYLTAEGGNFERTLKFSGDKAEFNKSFLMFFDEFGNNINELFKNKSDASPSEFKAFITAFNNDRYKAIESIENEIKPEKEAINWMKSYLNYRRAEELFEFGRKYKGDLPSNYYSFVSDYENPAPDDLKCSQYYEDFIGEYYFGYQFGQLDEYKKARNMFSNGKTYEGMNLIFDIIDSNVSNQIAKELLLTKVCTDNVRYDYEAVYSIYNNRYLPLVKTSDFQLLVKQKIEEKAIASRKARTIQDLMELEFIGEVFSEVNENHNGKVLYIDMWGTWCKGCIMQL